MIHPYAMDGKGLKMVIYALLVSICLWRALQSMNCILSGDQPDENKVAPNSRSLRLFFTFSSVIPLVVKQA